MWAQMRACAIGLQKYIVKLRVSASLAQYHHCTDAYGPTDIIEYNMQGVSVYSLPSYHNHFLMSPADSRVEAAKSELAAKSSDRGYHWQRPPPREASEQSH